MEAIYIENYEKLVDCAKQVIQDHALAEDCVQDAILAFHTKQVRPKRGAELAYLRAMVRNGAISKVRSESRRREKLQVEACLSVSPEAVVVSNITAEEITAGVAKLPPRQSAVVELRLRGMSVAESAAALSVSSGTIKTHRHRAAAAMRRSLREILVA